jgi:hypothetical protein
MSSGLLVTQRGEYHDGQFGEALGKCGNGVEPFGVG